MKLSTKFAALALAGAALLGVTACDSDASKVNENLATAADQFEVQRKIVGVNTRTDKYLFYVEGRCSIARDSDLVVTCKHGPDDYRKHYLSQATDVAWVVTQEEGVNASEYHTRIVVKPQNLLPNFDLEVGK
ncbi:hypothetical protein SEA_VROOMVROOM_32 [Arthrobacter phage VroomVroom]|uniref:Lipoprotein n=1 Tax=Arthrobacter phage VroomVroom TaxID=3049371 RepID=A0AA49FAD0_9CAUD|nr:hypothetical protein SEA_VROOMVROOM_32 [Arthrobacter phage VroomVroom]